MARRATITWPKDVYRKKVASLLAARGALIFSRYLKPWGLVTWRLGIGVVDGQVAYLGTHQWLILSSCSGSSQQDLCQILRRPVKATNFVKP